MLILVVDFDPMMQYVDYKKSLKTSKRMQHDHQQLSVTRYLVWNQMSTHIFFNCVFQEAYRRMPKIQSTRRNIQANKQIIIDNDK